MARIVLLADDSVTAQNMGRRILIDAGYEVITVNNGSAALKRIHESPPDLIVLDVYMPGYGGLEVCQRLKESSETARIPILLTVGKMEPFKAEEAKRARADGHIIKPFDASELLAALTRMEDRIVPQSTNARPRKSKSEKEKKSKGSSAAFDPAMSYDDTHSDKIAYLEQARARHPNEEAPEEAGDIVQAELEAAQRATSAAPDMPRPMSVYAAQALREMPVIAEPPAASDQGSGYEQSGRVEENVASEAIAAQTPSPDVAPAHVELVEEPATESPDGRIETPVEPGPSSLEEGARSPEPAVEEGAPALTSAPVPPEFQQPEVVASAPEASSPAVHASSETPSAKSRWVADNVPISAEEAALDLEREMRASSVSEVHADIYEQGKAEDQEQPALESAAISEIPVTGTASNPSEDGGATFAAAAAASAGSIASGSASAPDPQAPAASERAAAWENWQHIRDSVMGSQTAVRLSDAIAGAAKAGLEAADNDNSAGSVEVSQSTSAGAETAEDSEAALSNIVDSVLAELKPKLMAEISKKLKK